MEVNLDLIHPSHGTCREGCPWFGYCHCGCGEKTAICGRRSWKKGNVIQGNPYVFLRGHNIRVEDSPRVSVSVPLQRVLPLMEFLGERYGSWCAAARAMGASESTVTRWNRRGVETVTPALARRVVRAVKAEEKRLREEALPPERLKDRHYAHARRGVPPDISCELCLREMTTA